jgi:hypothetical protein
MKLRKLPEKKSGSRKDGSGKDEADGRHVRGEGDELDDETCVDDAEEDRASRGSM